MTVYAYLTLLRACPGHTEPSADRVDTGICPLNKEVNKSPDQVIHRAD